MMRHALGLHSYFLLMALAMALFSISPTCAFAYGGGDSLEIQHFLSVGGGIASPSFATAMTENAAGLIYNSQFKLINGAGTGYSNNLGFSANLLAGNGSVGGGLGLSTFNGSNMNAGQFGQMNYGLAASIDSIDLAFGVNGTYGLWDSTGSSTSTAGGWSLNLGMILSAHGPFRVGLAARQLLGGVNALGLGMAVDLGQNATFVIDSSTSLQFTGVTVKPGLNVSVGDVSMALSYGVDATQNGASSWLSRGVTAGIGARLSPTASLTAYYNELSTYYLGLSVNF